MTLSQGELRALQRLADAEGEPLARVAGRLLRGALATHGTSLDRPPIGRRSGSDPVVPPQLQTTQLEMASEQSQTAEPGWLPPSRQRRAIDAMRHRYPADMASVPDDLGNDTAALERLAALALVRQQIDAGKHRDPRIELAFHDELGRTVRWVEERRRTIKRPR
jgi:hypothetical protein